MLACARALTRLEPALPVGFVAWNGEEDGLLGSVEFGARRRSVRGAPIAAVQVLEMVGYASREPGSLSHAGRVEALAFRRRLQHRGGRRIGEAFG